MARGGSNRYLKRSSHPNVYSDELKALCDEGARDRLLENKPGGCEKSGCGGYLTIVVRKSPGCEGQICFRVSVLLAH